MPETAVNFSNQAGSTLAGQLHMPDGEITAVAIFAHCFTCTANVKAAVNIARALTEQGIGVLRFDFTGLGKSEGEFSETNFSSNVDDLIAAAEWLKAHHRAPEILVGHSLGGTAVLAAAPRIAGCRAVVTIGSPASADHVLELLGESRAEIASAGEATVQLEGRPFKIKAQFLEDVTEQRLPGALRDLRKALLVMHAPLDEVVSIDNASEIFASAKHPKSFISMDGADHLLSRPEDARYAGRVLAAWASHYVSDPVRLTTTAGQPDRGAMAQTGSQGFRTAVVAAGHPLVVDEPLEMGGGNAGPSPYDLLSAALASCTSMTLQMYARHKKLPLDNATVRVEHNKIHATDCEDCEKSEARVDHFERVIKLDGELSDSVRQRMLEIANRCPVHRTLEGEIKIVTRLKNSQRS